MLNFGLFVCLLLLGLSSIESMEQHDIVGYCQPAPKIILFKGVVPRRDLYDPRSSNCTWSNSAPDGYQVRFVCREILKPDEDKCVVDSKLLQQARSRGLYDYSCGKRMFNVFSNGPVLKLRLNTGQDEDRRTFRCDLEAVPEDKADCSCKCNEDSCTEFACLAAILTTKLQLGDVIISTSRRSEIPELNPVDYVITLVAVEKDAVLNWNAIPLCLQGNLPVDKFNEPIVTITDSEEQDMEGKRIGHSQCSAQRYGNTLNDEQICTMYVDLAEEGIHAEYDDSEEDNLSEEEY